MRMRDAAAEQRRRALFFDPVDIEIGPPGLPCDHLARTKPEVIAGDGLVTIGRIDGPVAKTIRVWVPPAASHHDATNDVRTEVSARFPAASLHILDSQRFLWCR
jgi:hypothetical protein